jgi:hypothetical protein
VGTRPDPCAVAVWFRGWKMPVKEEEKGIITIHNVHKTYLLGVEGVPALRGRNLPPPPSLSPFIPLSGSGFALHRCESEHRAR